MAESAEYYIEFMRNRITQLRRNAGASEHKMSLDLDKSGGYIRSITSGQCLPSVQGLFDICAYLNVTPEEFFAGADSRNSRTDIINRLQGLNEEDLQKVSLFLDWITGK